jgi:hypothetical protein
MPLSLCLWAFPKIVASGSVPGRIGFSELPLCLLFVAAFLSSLFLSPLFRRYAATAYRCHSASAKSVPDQTLQECLANRGVKQGGTQIPPSNPLKRCAISKWFQNGAKFCIATHHFGYIINSQRLQAAWPRYKASLKIVASGSLSGREAQPYECTMSIAGPTVSRAVDF